MGDTNTTKPRVVHVNKSEFDVYIGRKFAGFEASKWANPYTIGKDGTREEVIVKYEAYLKRTPELMKALPELENKVLACWCKGTNGTQDVACHGDVLVRLLEEEKRKEKPVAPPVLVQEAKQEVVISKQKEVAPILPIFASDSSFGESLLQFEESGKAISGNPLSVFDLALEHKLPYVTIVDSRIDGFLWAYEASEKVKIPMIFGVKMVVCDDLNDKNDISKRNESKVIIFIKNSAGYQDFLPIWNKANTDGLFRPQEPGGPAEQYGRIDWTSLAIMWTSNLGLALPFFSSFVARNAIKFANIVPTLPVPTNEIIAFREIDSRLPFSDILDKVLSQFSERNPAVTIQPIKTVYYRSSADFESYVLRRAIHEGGEFSRPNVDNLASDRFSMESWKELMS